MATLPSFFFFLFFLQSIMQIALCKKHNTHFFDICKPSRCNETSPEIRFPFRLDTSPAVCGVPGMELTCSSSNKETLLTFPNLGSTKVQSIDYSFGKITVELGDSWPSCLLPNITMMNLVYHLTTLVYQPMTEVVSLVTCRKLVPNKSDSFVGPVPCLSSTDQFLYVIDAFSMIDEFPSECTMNKSRTNILFTSYFNGDWPRLFEVIVDDFLVRRLVSLEWSMTNVTQQCSICEQRGRRCGYDLTTKEAFCKPHSRHNLNIKIISAPVDKDLQLKQQ